MGVPPRSSSIPAREPAAGDVFAGRYELEELVANGGMSRIFRAHDTALERHVALKVLHPRFGDDEEYIARFRREARIVAQLSHPHIVTVIDRGESDGHQFIVFEFVEGETLKGLLDRSGPLPTRRAVELALQIAGGLAYAHHNGLVHRDVKPQNVLLTRAGDAKVTDFGIARSLDVEHGVTQTGTVLGTSNYLSPEQANGEPVTAATDVYSLGVVLYELLAGEVPFNGNNLVAVAMRHVHEAPPSLLESRPDLPLRLVAAVEKALEKNPADRFPSMDAFAAELRRVLDELGESHAERTIVKPGPILRESRPHRMRAGRRARLPTMLMLAGLALLAAVVALLVLGGSALRHRHHGGAATGGSAVHLSGIGNFDPDGAPDSHANTAAAATDGNAQTTWYTQIYATPAFGNLKHGLGLELDAGRPVELARLTVTTPTPGFTAYVESAGSPSGPFARDSATQTVSGTTTFTLRAAAARYYVLWITQLPRSGKAEVSEVTAAR
jgi:eukaryotic-like serine/threonine-protein kinase